MTSTGPAITDEEREEFIAAMKSSWWMPVYDIFGGVPVQWQHERTKRVVSHETALNYWHMGKVTPVPF